MSTSNKLWCVFAVLILLFVFAFPTIGSRVGIMVEEGDADPSDYAWKLIFPNASLSVTNNVATIDLSGSYIATTMLDDTKGNGDTTYLWSADKIFD